MRFVEDGWDDLKTTVAPFGMKEKKREKGREPNSDS
jgi:hypothetical protein